MWNHVGQLQSNSRSLQLHVDETVSFVWLMKKKKRKYSSNIQYVGFNAPTVTNKTCKCGILNSFDNVWLSCREVGDLAEYIWQISVLISHFCLFVEAHLFYFIFCSNTLLSESVSQTPFLCSTWGHLCQHTTNDESIISAPSSVDYSLIVLPLPPLSLTLLSLSLPLTCTALSFDSCPQFYAQLCLCSWHCEG